MHKMVICRFKPKPGKDAALLEVLKGHLPTLWKLGLATPRKPILMRAGDGSILEVFEWESDEAVATAHTHPVVREMWGRFEACCTYESLAGLDELKGPFPHFQPVDL